MRAGRAQVGEEVGVGTARFFQGVRQDREAGEVEVAGGKFAFVVGGLGERLNRRGFPYDSSGDRAKGISSNLAE